MLAAPVFRFSIHYGDRGGTGRGGREGGQEMMIQRTVQKKNGASWGHKNMNKSKIKNNKLILTQILLCGTHCSKVFTYIDVFNPHNKSRRLILLLSPVRKMRG